MGYPVETMLDFDELRLRPGVTGVTVLVMGGLTIPPEDYGPFYWRADSTLPDDNRDVIKCNGVNTGRYLRAFTSGGIGGAGVFLRNSNLKFLSWEELAIPLEVSKGIKGRLITNFAAFPTRVIFDGSGLGKIYVESFFGNTLAGATFLDFWVRLNGTDIPNTRRSYTLTSTNLQQISFTEEFNVNKGDYVEIIGLATGNNTELQNTTKQGLSAIPFKLNVDLFNPIVT